jgi:hypothetical protein
MGDYDGRDRTLDVFSVAACDQRPLLRKLRGERDRLERAVGGPLIVIFHTPEETARLYPGVAEGLLPRAVRYAELAAVMSEWMRRDHAGEQAVDPTDVAPFNVEAA